MPRPNAAGWQGWLRRRRRQQRRPCQAGRCSGILLVRELVLDYLGLGTTAGALNPLDVTVLVIGCQDGLNSNLETE